MVSDCNAANSDEEHNATLHNIYLMFGDVMDSVMVEKVLRKDGD
jgi:hypothetical protein